MDAFMFMLLILSSYELTSRKLKL